MKSAFIKFRATPERKKCLTADAKKLGMSVSEMIEHALRNKVIRNSRNELDMKKAILEFSKQINHIGNNINQVTTILHGLKKIGAEANSSIREQIERFNNLLSDYNVFMNQANSELKKMYYSDESDFQNT